MKSSKYAAMGLTVVALAICLLGTYRHVFAQEESRRGNPPGAGAVLASPAETPALATNQVLERNYLVHGTQSGTTFPAGTFTAVDSVKTIQCPGPTGTCTIAADIEVQTAFSTTGSNNYAVCLYVDGVNVDTSDISNGCHYTADTPTDNTFVEGSGLDQLSGVKVGNHTVQTFLFTNNGTPVYNYNITYRVYKP